MAIAKKILLGMLGITMSLNGFTAEHAEVGEVTYARGVLTGQLDGEQPRLIGKGVGLHNGETLNTGSRGIALIELKDGTRMTLRPNTTFKIENVSTEKGSENALMSLIRGGLRAVTGLISKTRQDAFQINTPIATIGIRGTEFDARLCENDECQGEENAIAQKAERESRVVGRIALMRGKASAAEDGKRPRVLSVGTAIYERDQIETGIKSFAVIAFNDKTRVSLSPQSAFRVEEHEYKPEQPDENNSFLSFLRGGLRLVTGAIGRLNQNSFRVATPVATIGIRGTGFDMACEGTCISNSAAIDSPGDSVIGQFLNLFLRPAYAQNDGNGMYVKVWNGAVNLDIGGKIVPLTNGRTLFLKNSFSEPIPVADIPPRLGAFGGAPRPDKVPDSPEFFDETGQTDIDPGLYINVRDGDVVVKGVVDGREVSAGAGEAIRAGFNKTERLGFVPVFQKFDPVPNPARISVTPDNQLNLLRGKADGGNAAECTFQ